MGNDCSCQCTDTKNKDKATMDLEENEKVNMQALPSKLK